MIGGAGKMAKSVKCLQNKRGYLSGADTGAGESGDRERDRQIPAVPLLTPLDKLVS